MTGVMLTILPVFTFVVGDEQARLGQDQARQKAFTQKVLNGQGARVTRDLKDFTDKAYSTLRDWKDRRLESEGVSREGPLAQEAVPTKPLRQIYLSYGPGERAFAERLRRLVQAAGLEVWMDLLELDAALAGGVTSLACPPDTDPPLDEPGLVDAEALLAYVASGGSVPPQVLDPVHLGTTVTYRVDPTGLEYSRSLLCRDDLVLGRRPLFEAGDAAPEPAKPIACWLSGPRV